jgi:hypothetical protein
MEAIIAVSMVVVVAGIVIVSYIRFKNRNK